MSKLIASIVIPALNEEENISNILKDIKNQNNAPPLEIIIADAGSKDKTREIAKKYGAKIAKGGLPGKGRNSGVKISKGEVLIFLDADVRLPKNFLKNCCEEFLKRGYDAAAVDNIPAAKKKRWLYKTIYFFHNKFVRLMSKIEPHATATCLFAKKITFEKLKGFDETIAVFEDSEFVKRLFKNGFKFGVLNSSKIFISIRRFEKKGILKMIFKLIYGTLYRKFFGEIKKKEFYWN